MKLTKNVDAQQVSWLKPPRYASARVGEEALGSTITPNRASCARREPNASQYGRQPRQFANGQTRSACALLPTSASIFPRESDDRPPAARRLRVDPRGMRSGRRAWINGDGRNWSAIKAVPAASHRHRRAVRCGSPEFEQGVGAAVFPLSTGSATAVVGAKTLRDTVVKPMFNRGIRQHAWPY
jgi:hypothetical protein